MFNFPDLLTTNPTYLIILLLQVVFIIHAIKNGHASPWMYLMIFLPIVGIVAYIVVVILPDLNLNLKNLLPKATPSLKSLQEAVEEYPTVKNLQNLADAYANQGKYQDAIPLYRRCLTGFQADNTHIRRKLTNALFRTNQLEQAVSDIELIMQADDHRSEDHLLYARILSSLHKYAEALPHFKEAASFSTSLESDYYYIQFLKKQGLQDEVKLATKQAKKKYQELLPKYQRQEKKWLDKLL